MKVYTSAVEEWAINTSYYISVSCVNVKMQNLKAMFAHRKWNICPLFVDNMAKPSQNTDWKHNRTDSPSTDPLECWFESNVLNIYLSFIFFKISN